MGFIGHKLTVTIPISPDAEPKLKDDITAVIMGAYVSMRMEVECENYLDWGDFTYTDEGITMVLDGDPEGLEEVPDMISEVLGVLFSEVTGSWSIEVSNPDDLEHEGNERSSNGTF